MKESCQQIFVLVTAAFALEIVPLLLSMEEIAVTQHARHLNPQLDKSNSKDFLSCS